MIKRISISKEDKAALAAVSSCRKPADVSGEEHDYSTVVIQKPWGHEYSLVRTPVSDVWFLSIKQGERTSMHCHPTKKTSLVLLGGECEVTTFNTKTVLKAGEGIVIDKGVFHSTMALSPLGISLLETETPVDKKDLVRLNDAYGRAGTSYEGGKHVSLRDAGRMPSFYEADAAPHMALAECRLSVHEITDAGHFLRLLPEFSQGIVVVLAGAVLGKDDSMLFSHADAFHAHELESHADAISLTGNLKLLYVHTTI